MVTPHALQYQGAVPGCALDAPARQPTCGDLVGSELVPVRAVPWVALDDGGHAATGATSRRNRPSALAVRLDVKSPLRLRNPVP